MPGRPLFLALVVAACAAGSASVGPTSVPPTAVATAAPPTTPPPVQLTIFAAASLKGALGTIKAAYEAASPGTTIIVSLDSSSALETKIEQGAPSDVFLSADTTSPQRLIDAGIAGGTAVRFAGNKLVIIVPTGNPGGVTTPADLARSGLEIVAAGDTVPITAYATKLIDNLAALSGYPTDFAARYASNVTSKEENVKGIVAKIELGQGEAGIVYVTDAQASTRVETVVVPDEANVPATYAGVVVRASANQAAAQAFLTWLTGGVGQAIFGAFGFVPPA